jgi:hypothetical protein
MEDNMLYYKKIFLCFLILPFIFSCSTKKSIKFSKTNISSGSSIAVIIDCPNNAKNVVLTEFMKKKFRVKAINASDLYTLQDIYDIKDFKHVAYKSSLKDVQSLMSMEKTYDNLYKLHVYNFEANKAEILKEMKVKWDINYLIILDLKDWQNVSWGRAIDLSNYELVWVENYATKYNDNIETIIGHFIDSITGS